MWFKRKLLALLLGIGVIGGYAHAFHHGMDHFGACSHHDGPPAPAATP